MESSRSLRTRAVMALVLMVGFYGFALAITFGLLWIPYAEWAYTDRIHPKIWLFCIAGAGTILWALMPRRRATSGDNCRGADSKGLVEVHGRRAPL